MHRLVFLTLALGLVAVLTAAAARSERTNPAKVRNGKISFWSDRAFGGRAQVFVMNPNGTQQRRLTKLFSAKRADFSSDGRMLVLDGRGRETLHDFDVFVVNADGTGLRRLTSGPERDTQASWSPDGRLVSFVRVKDESSASSIWIVAADGSHGRHRREDDPRWRDRGRGLVAGRGAHPIDELPRRQPQRIRRESRRQRTATADARRRRGLRGGLLTGRPRDPLLQHPDGPQAGLRHEPRRLGRKERHALTEQRLGDELAAASSVGPIRCCGRSAGAHSGSPAREK